MNFDTIKDELLSIADTGLKYAQNKVKDIDIEIYLSQTQIAQIELGGGSVNARDSLESGIGVRVFNNKRKAFASTSGFEIQNLHDVIDDAISITNSISFIDKRFLSLPLPNSPGKEGTLDPSILEVDSKLIGNEILSTVEECKKVDDRIISVSGSRSAICGVIAVANSNNISAASRYTGSSAYITTIAKQGDKQKSFFGYDFSRNKELNLNESAIESSKTVIELLDSKPLGKSEVIPVFWDKLTVGMFFGLTFGNSITGGAVIEGQSYFADKIGDEIGIKNLSIVDDGQLPEAPATNAIDSEGIPMKKTNIVEKGILKSFLSNSYYSNLLSTEPTGNSQRGMSANPSYESPPITSKNTLIVSPGSKSFDKLLSEIDNGIYIKGILMGIGHTNQITGTMSAVSTCPFLIENGELKHALDPVNISGNIYTSLSKIREIGNNSFLGPFGIKSPSIIMDGLTVTG